MNREQRIEAAEEAAGCKFNIYGECETHDGYQGPKGGTHTCSFVTKIIDAYEGTNSFDE